MQYLEELLRDNGDRLVVYNNIIAGKEYINVFEYSVKYGGTYDSHKYYNNFVVEISSK